MIDYASILSAAEQLPERERLQLIHALWDSVGPDAEDVITAEWAREIETRIDGLEQGIATTTPWSEVRQAALDRIGYGKNG